MSYTDWLNTGNKVELMLLNVTLLTLSIVSLWVVLDFIENNMVVAFVTMVYIIYNGIYNV